ncbi:DUF6115 domain-containing protein [Pseudalkalibacillus sp. Hm43]|uniref:DUF6115 domain-containing protein n=1 Tax=Pseudalkalibacillus sp. Hm43 TaxID=3450742 RepID=UPI003F428936
MTGFLLGISFLIHIITLLSIIILWKKFQATDDYDVKKAKQEMEDILLAYTTEMKEENDAFLKELQQVTQSKEPHLQKSEQYKDLQISDDSERQIETSDFVRTEDVSEPYTPPVDDTKETFGPSLLSQVLSLKDKGYTIEEIAKKVDKGKGEIELLIKFHQDGR